jgi:hypothetical protein
MTYIERAEAVILRFAGQGDLSKMPPFTYGGQCQLTAYLVYCLPGVATIANIPRSRMRPAKWGSPPPSLWQTTWNEKTGALVYPATNYTQRKTKILVSWLRSCASVRLDSGEQYQAFASWLLVAKLWM